MMLNLKETIDIGYIYGLVSTENLDLIRYIGLTKNSLTRLQYHKYEAKSHRNRKCNWIKSVYKKGFEIELIILCCLPLDELDKKEIEYIKLYKSFGARLVNGTDGGFGVKTSSGEIGKKVSASLKEGYLTGRIINHNKGIPMTEEQKLKISITKQGHGNRKIYSINKFTGERILHPSIKIAAAYTKVDRTAISSVLVGRLKGLRYPYHFEYLNKEVEELKNNK